MLLQVSQGERWSLLLLSRWLLLGSTPGVPFSLRPRRLMLRVGGHQVLLAFAFPFSFRVTLILSFSLALALVPTWVRKVPKPADRTFFVVRLRLLGLLWTGLDLAFSLGIAFCTFAPLALGVLLASFALAFQGGNLVAKRVDLHGSRVFLGLLRGDCPVGIANSPVSMPHVLGFQVGDNLCFEFLIGVQREDVLTEVLFYGSRRDFEEYCAAILFKNLLVFLLSVPQKVGLPVFESCLEISLGFWEYRIQEVPAPGQAFCLSFRLELPLEKSPKLKAIATSLEGLR